MRNKNLNLNIKKKILIKYSIFFFILISYINLKYSLIIFNFYFKFNDIENYLKLCENSGITKEKSIKNKSPKVSIISPVYNREKYILRFLRSIQNQKFKEIEIIFIDDGSKDKSIKKIEKYRMKDERILLIKHKKNKGTFICRNIGVLNSKGKYVMLPDPDDILSKNIIKYCYNFLEIYNFDMIRFNIYYGNNKIFFYNRIKGLANRPIYQPELSTYLFYGKGILLQIDFNVSNKFIKREAYIRALNSLNIYYLNIYMTIFEDGLMNYILYRSAKSFYFIKKIGYYYLKNNQSISRSNFKNKNLLLKFIFIYLRIIFEFSKNNIYEKNMANYLFSHMFKRKNIKKYKKFLNNDINFFKKIINMYFNCKYINNKNKIILNNFKSLLYNKF